ncbi:MAG: hypothetical protein JJT88_14035 [Gammaproteobacteria bacterium]|nr:hypothetical protein [Gammaproteobacteria bacterium]
MANPTIRMACCAVIASGVLLLTVPGHAHPGHGPAGDPMSKALDLTEEQRAALQQARREAMAAKREARSSGMDRGEWRREHGESMREIYAGILTHEQMAKLDDLREQRRGRQRDRLSEALDLHSDQVEPVQTILSEARRGAAKDGAGWRERRDAVREQLSGILTPAQLERFDAMHSGRREAGMDRRMARLSERLELHSSQVEPVREVLEQFFTDMHEQMRSLRSEQDGEAVDRRALRQAMVAERERIQADTREQLSGILTPAQLEQFDGLRTPRQSERRQRKGG